MTTASRITGRMPRLPIVRHIGFLVRIAANRLEKSRRKAIPTAIVMVTGKVSKRPPATKSDWTAAIPAPTRTPALMAEGISETTLEASPVAPNVIEKTPSMNWNAMSACTRSSPSGNAEQ